MSPGENIEALLAFPEIQAVAVCDVNREGGRYLSWNWTEGRKEKLCGREPARRLVEQHYAAQQRSGPYRGCRAYVDYRELLEKEDVDAVITRLGSHLHF